MDELAGNGESAYDLDSQFLGIAKTGVRGSLIDCVEPIRERLRLVTSEINEGRLDLADSDLQVLTDLVEILRKKLWEKNQ